MERCSRENTQKREKEKRRERESERGGVENERPERHTQEKTQ